MTRPIMHSYRRRNVRFHKLKFTIFFFTFVLFLLGKSVKGNGTCQLSSSKIDLSTGRRPAGTIYDPDFDIYQRKENCGIDDIASSPPQPGGTLKITNLTAPTNTQRFRVWTERTNCFDISTQSTE